MMLGLTGMPNQTAGESGGAQLPMTRHSDIQLPAIEFNA